MTRWLEHLEQKLSELLRCMRSFGKMSEVWTKLSQLQPDNSPGHIAYAKKTAAMYGRMEKECQDRFDEANGGHNDLRLKVSNSYGDLISHVMANRAKEEGVLKELSRCNSKVPIG